MNSTTSSSSTSRSSSSPSCNSNGWRRPPRRRPKLKPTTKDAYQFFHQGTIALSRVESNGIRIDTKYLDRAIPRVDRQIKRLEKQLQSNEVSRAWKRRYGRDTNYDSAQQLGAVLFGTMKFKYPGTPGKDKKGMPTWSTDEAVLAKVNHSFCKKYLRIKKLKKAKTTYLEGIRREVDDRGFLHPSFNLVSGKGEGDAGGALSYRGSSSEPNFQNMPIRNPSMSKLIRPAVIARKGCRLAEVDFSQLEVCISVGYNKDPVLKRYVTDPKSDMHKDTACDLFMLKPEQVGKKTTRQGAKNQFVFPQFYGSYYPDCARALWENMVKDNYIIEGTEKKRWGRGIRVIDHLRKKGIKKLGDCRTDTDVQTIPGTFVHHVKLVEQSFWNERFKVYTAWKKKWYQEYLKKGYFDLYTGFRCKGVYRRNQVINFPVQGAAFHCLLWCIIQIQKKFKEMGMKSLIVGEIHDCVLLDIPVKETQRALNVIERVMTKELAKEWKWINVPLKIEVDISPKNKSWLEKEQWLRRGDGKWVPKRKLEKQR